MIQQNDESMEQNNEPTEPEIVEDIIFSHRQRIRKCKDLEDRFDLIYKFIEQNYLLLDTELNDEKNKFETKLERLKNTNLTLIEDLEVKKKQIDYETQLSKYNSLKEEIRLFSAKIYDVYAGTINKWHEQDKNFRYYMTMYAEAQKTPNVTSQTWITNALDDAYLHYAIESGMIDRKQADALREKAMKFREMNEQKARVFKELTEKLKKEKGEN